MTFFCVALFLLVSFFPSPPFPLSYVLRIMDYRRDTMVSFCRRHEDQKIGHVHTPIPLAEENEQTKKLEAGGDVI